MRHFLVAIGMVVVAVVISASPVRAERWVNVGAPAAVRQELRAGFAFCVDLDSVKTNAQGWTSYHYKLCNDTRDIFDGAVKCKQDFSADQIPIRTRMFVTSGKPSPNQPWKTVPTYVSSMAGKIARFVCHK